MRSEVGLGSPILGNGQATRTEAGFAVQITGQVRHGEGGTCVTENQDAPLFFCDFPARH